MKPGVAAFSRVAIHGSHEKPHSSQLKKALHALDILGLTDELREGQGVFARRSAAERPR